MIATGLSSAIGQALIRRVRDDYHIVALGRTPLNDVEWIEADFTRAGWPASLKEWLSRDGWAISAWVHLAGVVYSDAMEATTQDEWRRMMAVNLESAFQMGQLLSSRLTPGAHVVLVGSVDADKAAYAGPAAAYGASKAALRGLVRQWAVQWGQRHICVNGVAPGALTSGSGPSNPEVEKDLVQHIALGRLGQPEDVAATIAWLLSPGADYITGAWIPVDGGLNLGY